MAQPGVNANTAPAFLEKDFYLREFRGRNLAIAASAADLRDAPSLAPLLDELAANGTGAVVISTERSALEPLVGDRILSATTPRIEAVTWRRLREGPGVGILVGGSLAFAPAVRDVAARLRCSKLVWTDREGGLARPGGERLSFVHLEELDELIAAPGAFVERRLGILREVRTLLGHGLPAVNLCRLEGLAEELFTYAGSGTLFTRDRYVIVRPLGLDDFNAADDLISRGVEEGWLARRSAEAVDEVLASGFGAFVEDVHLAGIGALLVDPATRTGEIASMYTLTRFLGEGIGGHLITHARRLAREQGLSYLYACTTSPRVVAFFERNGLCVVPQEAVPVTKWRGYDVARRPSVICLREDLATGSRD
jgi:N-acetylglutamate synthase-like GNAT family acetyltransferase